MRYGRIRVEDWSIVKTLLLGLLLREALSFWTGHPSDFELWVRLGFAVANGINPYQSLPPVQGLSFANVYSNINSPTIAYLPFWPILTGLIYLIFKAVGVNSRFVYYLLLKQPVILGDVTLGFLLYRYVKPRNVKRSKWVLSFWMLCPFPIIIAAVWGMFDSIAMSFVMLAILANRNVSRAFWNGMGIFAKSIPIIFTLPIAFRDRAGWKWLGLTLAVPLCGFAVFILAENLPLSIGLGTLSTTVSKGGESMSVWDLFFYLSNMNVIQSLQPNTYRVLGSVWIFALIAFTVIAHRKLGFETEFGLFQSLLVMILVFLIFKSRVTEQYSIYLLALSVVDVTVWNPSRKKLLSATTGVALLYLLSNNYFLIRFLSPLSPSYLQLESVLSQQIGSYRLLANLCIGSAFTLLNVIYLFLILDGKHERTGRPESKKLV